MSDFFSLLFAEQTITMPYIVGNLFIVFAIIGIWTCIYLAWWIHLHLYGVD
jgi:hypothetical protein